MVESHTLEITVDDLVQIHKNELAVKDAYLEGYKKELLKQLAMERLKVIELQKELARIKMNLSSVGK